MKTPKKNDHLTPVSKQQIIRIVRLHCHCQKSLCTALAVIFGILFSFQANSEMNFAQIIILFLFNFQANHDRNKLTKFHDLQGQPLNHLQTNTISNAVT